MWRARGGNRPDGRLSVGLRTVRPVLLHHCCVVCDRPGEVLCHPCAGRLAPPRSLPPPLGIDVCDALFDYASARRVVMALKNGNRRDLVGWLGAAIAARLEVPEGAVVTWAPTGASRRRGRGYDQAELLARAVARRSGLPCVAILRRAGGPPQAGRSALERWASPSFTARSACAGCMVVVDDVVTTGATLTAAARGLRAAGAAQVLAAVVARSAGRGAG